MESVPKLAFNILLNDCTYPNYSRREKGKELTFLGRIISLKNYSGVVHVLFTCPNGKNRDALDPPSHSPPTFDYDVSGFLIGRLAEI